MDAVDRDRGHGRIDWWRSATRAVWLETIDREDRFKIETVSDKWGRVFLYILLFWGVVGKVLNVLYFGTEGVARSSKLVGDI
jgi:hypothetical protein